MLPSRVALIIAVVSAAPCGAQAPITADSLNSIVAAASRVTRDLTALAAKSAPLQEDARLLIMDYKSHNSTPCEYLDKHPEMCDSYDNERQLLDVRKARLVKELALVDAPRHALQAEFAALMTRLQTGEWDAAIASRKSRALGCAVMKNPDAAVRCLKGMGRES